MSPLLDALLNDHLDKLEDRNLPKIARFLGVEVSEVAAAARLIRGLDPYPGLRYQRSRAEYIYPDVYVIKMGDEYQVYLNDDGLPRLRINGYYRRIIQQGANAADKAYLGERFKSALWLIRSIEQRRQTLLKVSRSIVHHQRDFFDGGLEALHPLVLRQVAEDIEMHESTVSRVTTQKYMHTPQGVLELKFFFNGGLGLLDGESMSSTSVKEQVRRLVEKEDPLKPLTDEQIGEALRARSIIIARRTVTKYRKELKLPTAGKRKKVCT